MQRKWLRVCFSDFLGSRLSNWEYPKKEIKSTSILNVGLSNISDSTGLNRWDRGLIYAEGNKINI